MEVYLVNFQLVFEHPNQTKFYFHRNLQLYEKQKRFQLFHTSLRYFNL